MIGGSNGACANGAFIFPVEVNVWEYSELPNGEPSTKTHHKYTVITLAEEQRPQHSNYKYLIEEHCCSQRAFRTDEEYFEWQQTLIIDKIEQTRYANTIILWTRK